MGKASRSKRLKRQEVEVLKKYGGIKLSAALLSLCDPYLIADMTKKRYDKLISFGVAAWNIAILPESQRGQEFIKIAQRIPELKEVQVDELTLLLANGVYADDSDSVVMLQVLSGMVRRKLELYPDDDRIVINFWFESKDGSDILQVKSVIPNAAAAQ